MVADQVSVIKPLLFALQPQSDLYGLIQVMIVVFGEEPPVFSRPTTQGPFPTYQAAGPPNCEWETFSFVYIQVLQGILT